MNISPLADGEDALRSMIAESKGTAHVFYKSLAEVQQDPDGVVILQGDDGGTIYLTCPASKVACSEQTIWKLLREVDKEFWGNPEDMAKVFFERLPVGSGVWGGMSGGGVQEDVWVHPELVRIGVSDETVEVVHGGRSGLSFSAIEAICKNWDS